jgi:sterol desaturase/sphingolipid hydroxylase (fatty acid hydroxylase superfamily)
VFSQLRLALRHELESPVDSRKFGSGWFSGVLAIVLALASFLLLLSQAFPTLFAFPVLADLHSHQLFIRILQVVMLLAFILADMNLVLRRNKVLGFSAIILVLAASLIGQWLERRGVTKIDLITQGALGLDWFVLNLLFTGSLFIPLEKLFGRLTDQPLFRTEWREDLFYFLLSSLLVQLLTYLSLSPSLTLVAQTASLQDWRLWVAALPLVVQVLTIMLLTDFVQYWFHRAFHQLPFLWRFHAVHHSAQTMDWLAGSRMHLFEIIALRGLTIVPMYFCGFSESALHIYILFVYLNATFVHANVRFNVEWLKPFIVTPRFHHWHHGLEREAIDVNFAIHFPWLDKLFGTYYMPAKQWPKGYGIGGHPVPNGYWKQFCYPFAPKKRK